MTLSLLSGCGDSKTADEKAEDAMNSFAAAIENGDEDAARDALEAVESSGVYQEQFITWGYDADAYRNKYTNLDYEIQAKTPTEQGLQTGCGTMNIRGGDNHSGRVRARGGLPRA